MNKPIASLSALAAAPLFLLAADAAAATDAEDPRGISEPPAISEPAAVPGAAAVGPRGPWLIRAEGSLVDMRDNWLGFPGLETGLTVGRYMTPRLAVEVTGNAREGLDDRRRSWSTMAVGRGVLAANATGKHAFTVAAGPMFQIGHAVHGNLPFAHTELAYVFRSSIGLTVLAGAGVNVALSSSSYVEPPPTDCPDSGHSFAFCLDLGPDAREIHAGDRTATARVAVGWQF